MKKLPLVSIVIPTFNREKVLKEALLSLNGVSYPRNLLEVVVVSDGSIDDTAVMVEKIKKELNYKFKFIKEKRKGISHAKNAAIKNSQGEIIVSTDDDCLFEPDWLKKLVRPLSDPKIGSVGGSDRAIKKEGILAKSIDFAFSSFVGSGGIHGRFLKVNLGKFYPPGCNMAFSRKMVEKIGIFDENLAPGEDTDFNHRIEKAGFKLIYLPEAFVWHRPKNNIKTFIPYILNRGAARLEIIRRHSQYAELIYLLPAMMVLIALLLLFLSFFSVFFFKIFILLFIIYGLFLLSAGLSAFLTYHNPLYILIVPFFIFLQHVLHGIGFLIAAGKNFLK